MPAVNENAVGLVLSGSGLLSGGLSDCPTALAKDCRGGVATVAAYIRAYTNETGDAALFLPRIDRQSAFVQMHPLGWNVNRLVQSDHFGWTVILSSLSILTSDRDLSYMQTHSLPLLISNAHAPPSNSWFEFLEFVHFDESTRLAVIHIENSGRATWPNSWPSIPSTLNALDYIAKTNEGVAGVDRWIPVVTYRPSVNFPSFLTAVLAHDNPPAILIDCPEGAQEEAYNVPRMVNRTWVSSFKERENLSHRHRIYLGANNSVLNVTLHVDDLHALPTHMKDSAYVADQEYLKTLVDEALSNDPVVGSSGDMPLTREGDTRMCMAGECIIGNLWTDALRWKAKVDVAFYSSGGLRGPGWGAGEVLVSDLWAANPFVETMCTGVMSGITLFRLLNYSTSVATFMSTFTPMGDRLLQVSGLRYVYNTKLSHSRLVAVDVWDNAINQFVPLERLRMYSFVTDSWMCKVFDPFPDFFGGSAVEGEIPGSGTSDDTLTQFVVAEYLSQLGKPYDTRVQGRLRNDTSVWSHLNMVHVRERCPPHTFWEVQIQTCSPCPEGTHQPQMGQTECEPTVPEEIDLIPVGMVLMSTVALTSIGFGFWVYWNRKVRLVRVSQPPFLIMLCIGTLVMGATIIPLSIDESDVACMSVPWLLNMGFTVTFSALFSKIWRVHIIFQNASKYKRIKVTPKDVMVPFAVLFTLNFAFLLSWTLVDPRRWNIDQKKSLSEFGACRSEGNASVIFTALLGVVNIGALGLACIQAYRSREISDEYSESKYVAITVASLLQVSMVGLPVMFLVDDDPTATYFLQSILIFILCMSTLLLIFVPKIVTLRNLRKNNARKQAGGANVDRTYSDATTDGLNGANSSHMPTEHWTRSNHSGNDIENRPINAPTSSTPVETCRDSRRKAGAAGSLIIKVSRQKQHELMSQVAKYKKRNDELERRTQELERRTQKSEQRAQELEQLLSEKKGKEVVCSSDAGSSGDK